MEEPTRGDWGDGKNLPGLSLVSLVAESKPRPQARQSEEGYTEQKHSLPITWGKISKALGTKVGVAAARP